MTAARALAMVGVACGLAVAAGCAKAAVQAPAPRDVIALAADPESGDLGALTVTTPQGAVTLDAVHHSTSTTAGSAPAAPAVLSDEAVQRLFGDAIAVLPPPARRFLLYFELGGDTLTPDSRALVPEILATVRSREAVDVSVVGHTDTTGAAAANIELGMRRATLIRDLLVGAGLDAAVVAVSSHGEANPVVPTPDNTAEARNRRVEVTVR